MLSPGIVDRVCVPPPRRNEFLFRLNELRLFCLLEAVEGVDGGAPTPCVDWYCVGMNCTEYKEGGICVEEVGVKGPWFVGEVVEDVTSRRSSWYISAVRCLL